MPLTLPLPTLTQAANAIQSIANKSSFFPAAAMAFLSVEDGTLTIKGTDVANWLFLAVPGNGATTAKDIQVDASKLADLIGKLSGDTVSLDIKDGYLHLSAGRSKRKLAGVATAYPEPAVLTADRFDIDMDALADAIAFVSPIVGTEHQLQYIHGVRLQDGHAIGTNAAGFCAAAFDWPVEPMTLTLPSVKLLKHVQAPAQAAYADSMVSFSWDGGLLMCKTLDGPWSFLANGVAGFLKEHDTFLTVHPSELLRAVSAVDAVAANDTTAKSNRVSIALDKEGCEIVPASNIGSAVEPFDGEWSGEPLTIHLLLSNLRKVLAGFDPNKDVTIGITALPDDPKLVKGCVIRQEVMPGHVSMISQVR